MIVVFKSEYEGNKVGRVKSLPDDVAQQLIKQNVVAEVNEKSRIADIAKTRVVNKGSTAQ